MLCHTDHPCGKKRFGRPVDSVVTWQPVKQSVAFPAGSVQTSDDLSTGSKKMKSDARFPRWTANCSSKCYGSKENCRPHILEQTEPAECHPAIRATPDEAAGLLLPPDSGRDVFPLFWIYRNVFALQNGATAENPLTSRQQVDTLNFSLKLLTSDAVKNTICPKQ